MSGGGEHHGEEEQAGHDAPGGGDHGHGEGGDHEHDDHGGHHGSVGNILDPRGWIKTGWRSTEAPRTDAEKALTELVPLGGYLVKGVKKPFELLTQSNGAVTKKIKKVVGDTRRKILDAHLKAIFNKATIESGREFDKKVAGKLKKFVDKHLPTPLEALENPGWWSSFRKKRRDEILKFVKVLEWMDPSPGTDAFYIDREAEAYEAYGSIRNERNTRTPRPIASDLKIIPALISKINAKRRSRPGERTEKQKRPLRESSRLSRMARRRAEFANQSGKPDPLAFLMHAPLERSKEKKKVAYTVVDGHIRFDSLTKEEKARITPECMEKLEKKEKERIAGHGDHHAAGHGAGHADHEHEEEHAEEDEHAEHGEAHEEHAAHADHGDEHDAHGNVEEIEFFQSDESFANEIRETLKRRKPFSGKYQDLTLCFDRNVRDDYPFEGDPNAIIKKIMKSNEASILFDEADEVGVGIVRSGTKVTISFLFANEENGTRTEADEVPEDHAEEITSDYWYNLIPQEEKEKTRPMTRRNAQGQNEAYDAPSVYKRCMEPQGDELPFKSGYSLYQYYLFRKKVAELGKLKDIEIIGEAVPARKMILHKEYTVLAIPVRINSTTRQTLNLVLGTDNIYVPERQKLRRKIGEDEDASSSSGGWQTLWEYLDSVKTDLDFRVANEARDTPIQGRRADADLEEAFTY